MAIAFAQTYYALETNEGLAKFRYFKGNSFNEVFFPVFVLDYLLGKGSLLGLYFAFD
jgi:hypothetical protein